MSLKLTNGLKKYYFLLKTQLNYFKLSTNFFIIFPWQFLVTIYLVKTSLYWSRTFWSKFFNSLISGKKGINAHFHQTEGQFLSFFSLSIYRLSTGSKFTTSRAFFITKYLIFVNFCYSYFTCCMGRPLQICEYMGF